RELRIRCPISRNSDSTSDRETGSAANSPMVDIGISCEGCPTNGAARSSDAVIRLRDSRLISMLGQAIQRGPTLEVHHQSMTLNSTGWSRLVNTKVRLIVRSNDPLTRMNRVA